MKKFFAFLLCAATLAGFAGCSDGDENSAGTALLPGVWYCTYQKWTEDGKTWDASYTASGTYYIRFSTDGTGNLSSGPDELMELGGYYDFTWSVSGKTIHVLLSKGNNEFEDVWEIKKLTEDELTLCWSDSGYSITCNFVKAD